jgi:hypothetical protein
MVFFGGELQVTRIATIKRSSNPNNYPYSTIEMKEKQNQLFFRIIADTKAIRIIPPTPFHVVLWPYPRGVAII